MTPQPTTEGPAAVANADAEKAAAQALRRSVTGQFGRSLHIRTLDTGSCAACEQEIRLLAAPHYDLHRLGFFFTPARGTPTCSWSPDPCSGPSPSPPEDLQSHARPEAGRRNRSRALGGVYQPDAVQPRIRRPAATGRRVDSRLPPNPIALLQGLLSP